MDYVRYDRFFVMLDEESSEFAMRQSAKCGGHIKIETGNGKGAMRIGVRNLRYFDKGEYIYKLILFGTVKERTIYAIVGTVNVGRTGSGETYFKFDPKNMDKSGHELAEFSHAIVAAVSMNNENEPLHPVMKGILEIPFYEPKLSTPRNCYNTYYNRYILARCHKMAENRNVYDRVVPFKEDVTSAEWTKMSPETEIPIVSPGAKCLAQRYKHYIFGTTDENYYFGVPGRFLREEQPEGGESGFLLWQPILGAEELNATEEEATDEIRNTAYGYWIVAVCIETGDILEA